MEKQKFSVWKTITIGNELETAREFKKKLAKLPSPKYITYRAYYLLDLIKYFGQVRKLDLVMVTAKDLNITEWDTRVNLAEDGMPSCYCDLSMTEYLIFKAKKCGLRVCPPEVGQALMCEPYDSLGNMLIGMESVSTIDPLNKLLGEDHLRFRIIKRRDYVVDEWFEGDCFLDAFGTHELGKEDVRLSTWVFVQ